MFVLTTISLIVWILLDTRYVIKENNLLYRSGPFRGRINILEIKTIEQYSGTNPPVTMKPALDNKGFILHYNQYDNLFISPVESEIFIDTLVNINSKIELK
ncbi:MAG: PH domain-containing protein [Flavobacterium sp.]|nr:PH domain-containing protein [Flavobacterium sp.]